MLAFLFDFDEILHRSWDPKSKNAFVWGSKSDDPFSYFTPIFHPRNVFSMGRSKYRSNKASGPIVAVKSSNDVPRDRAATSKKLQNAVTPKSAPKTQQESPAVADKPARRLRKVRTVYVRAMGL